MADDPKDDPTKRSSINPALHKLQGETQQDFMDRLDALHKSKASNALSIPGSVAVPPPAMEQPRNALMPDVPKPERQKPPASARSDVMDPQLHQRIYGGQGGKGGQIDPPGPDDDPGISWFQRQAERLVGQGRHARVFEKKISPTISSIRVEHISSHGRSPPTSLDETLGRVYDEIAARDVSRNDEDSGETMSNHGASTGTAFTVFDYLGLGVLLEPPAIVVHALMSGEHLSWTNALYGIPSIAIGALLIVIGRNWNRIKNHISKQLAENIDAAARSYVVLTVIFILVGGIVVSPILIWPPNTPERLALANNQTELQQVIGKTFQNREVVIDGKWFINCTFDNVTMVYNGGQMRIDNPTRKGTFAFRTDTLSVTGSVELLKMFGVLEPDFAARWKADSEPQK